jgi:hypothetical protein
MSVNSITGNLAQFQMQPMQPNGSTDKSVKETPASNDQLSTKAVQVSPLDALTDNNKSTAIKKTAVASNAGSSQPAGIVSHVVESYNQYGKVRVKFMDSRNNVVYQTPSEMVAKIEDQMKAPNTSANVKG